MPLTTGCSHVALVTEDLDRLIAFYRDVLGGEVTLVMDEGDVRHAFVDLGGGFALHPFEVRGPNEHATGLPQMFGRGHLDHLAISVADEETFQTLRRRLVEAGASDGTVTDFGSLRSVWFTDPDGMGCEITRDADGEPLAFANRLEDPYVPVEEARSTEASR